MRTGKPSFGIRTTAVYFTVALLLFVCAVRIIYVDLQDYAAASTQGRVTLVAERHRGTVFDRNLLPLTNLPGGVTAAVVPTPRSLTALKERLDGDEFEKLRDRLETGKPAAIRLDEPLYASGITNLSARIRYSDLAPHIVGYTGGDGHGVAGIEKAFDTMLFSTDVTSLIYNTDAVGAVLPGVRPAVDGAENKAAKSGVVLTLDSRIQRIVQDETAALGCGAAVVVDVSTSQVLALHSLPTFDRDRIADYLDAKDSPFLNRALTTYNAGSVFKVCVAMAALENGVDADTVFNCGGRMEIDGTDFVCNRASGHGSVDLIEATSRSCNVYFYSLALSIPAGKLISAAEKMGFTASVNLAPGLNSGKCRVPSEGLLSRSRAAVANYAIGQGEIMVTPLSLAAAYAAVANGGVYRVPTVVYGAYEDGVFSPSVMPEGERIMSGKTAGVLKKALTATVERGTGTAAAPDDATAAGKTATAQTGWIKDGHPVVESWFCGFFPAEKPKYVIAVLKEDGRSGSADCAPVFKAIADGIMKLK